MNNRLRRWSLKKPSFVSNNSTRLSPWRPKALRLVEHTLSSMQKHAGLTEYCVAHANSVEGKADESLNLSIKGAGIPSLLTN